MTRIFLYIAEESVEIAADFVADIHSKIEWIVETDFTGSPRDHIRKGLRGFPYRKRCIYYRSYKDRIVVMVRDPFWLHTYWDLTGNAIRRAEAALGQDWHGAKPILRLLDVSGEDTTNTIESPIRDIEIHGGCNNWYIEVSDPPRSFRVDIGYISRTGQFVRDM